MDLKTLKQKRLSGRFFVFILKKGLIDKAIDEDVRGADYVFTLEIGDVTDNDISKP